MSTLPMDPKQSSWKDSAGLVLSEIQLCTASLALEPWEALGRALVPGRAIFLLGEGRSGLVARMFAMRLMHLGLASHVVGETTTPSIGIGDLLIAVSGSGAAGTVHLIAGKAKQAGAEVVAITVDSQSPLAKLSDQVITIPAATKADRSGTVSEQFAGSLFEQTVLICCDSLFHSLSRRSQQAADTLWSRHTNLE